MGWRLTARARGRRTALAAGLALVVSGAVDATAAAAGAATAPAASPREPPALPDHPPGDPNDAPLLDPPYGQPRPTARRFEPGRWSPAKPLRRIQLTVMPTWSVLRLPFLGRPDKPIHGAGVGWDLDVAVWRALWVRLSALAAFHPVRAHSTRNDDDEVVPLAGEGRIRALSGAIGLAYALDLGRIAALVDAGLGVTRIDGPAAVQDGQEGGSCRSGGLCDPGLSCGAENLCRPTLVPTIHAGVAAEWFIGRWVTLGAQARYAAPLAGFSANPFWFTIALRLGLRF